MKSDANVILTEQIIEGGELYSKLCKIEGNYWGNLFADDAFLAGRQRDSSARRQLGFQTAGAALKPLLSRIGIECQSGLSLGCGSGRAEQSYFAQGIAQSFHGIDVSQDAIEKAIKVATEKSLPFTYSCADLNFLDLEGKTYDFIVCQTILHHVVNLEHLLDEILSAMTPTSVFYVTDYIGETQFQFSDERLQIMNDILELIPESLTQNKIHTHQNTRKIQRPKPGKLCSPFEAIRSGEIRDLLMEKFEVLWKEERTSFSHRVLPQGTAENYMEDEYTQAIGHILAYFDQLLIDKSVLPPTSGAYLLKTKA